MKCRVVPETRSHPFCNLVRVGIVVALLVTMLGIVPRKPVHAVNTVDDEDNSDRYCSKRHEA